MGVRIQEGSVYGLPYDQTRPPEEHEAWRERLKEEQARNNRGSALRKVSRSIVEMSQTPVAPFPEASSEVAEDNLPPAA